MHQSCNYPDLQPRWQRVTPQPRSCGARSSSEQRDYRSIERETVGCKTILELRFNTTTAADFPGDVGGVIRNFYYKITHYVPQTRIAFVCDEKDNYRFGFNGVEK